MAALSALEKRIELVTEGKDGVTFSPVSGLRFYRQSRAAPPKRVVAQMVTLAVVVRGSKHVDFGDTAFTYGPGSHLFVTEECRYISHIHDASPEAPYLSMAVELAPEDVTAMLLALRDAGAEPKGDTDVKSAYVARNARPLLGALVRLIDASRDPIQRVMLAPLVRKELIARLLQSPAGAVLRRVSSSDDARIRKAMRFLEARLGERPRVEEVARHVMMSPSHFAHRFREIVRMSPMQYAKHQRMQQARILMLSKGYNAAQAGNALGYASASHFARDFKGYFGVPPATYVQQLRSQEQRPRRVAGRP